MTTSTPQTNCVLCGEPCPDQSDRWWPSEDGEICQDCWEAMDEPITSSDIKALKKEIDLLLPQEFHVPANPFDLSNDFDHLGVECAEESRN
jgi:hypothetical protein